MKNRILIWSAMILVVAVMAAHSTDDFDDEPIIGDDEDTGLVESYDVIRTAREYGTLDLFVNMLEQSGLIERLQGDGPYTLFIPDDSAFKALDAEWLKRVRADGKQMEKLLSRHIVTDAAITFGREETFDVVSLGGDTLRITADAEKVTVNNAEVLDEEIECSNGIIHVIDAVLVNP